MRILIIEDEPLTAVHLKTTLLQVNKTIRIIQTTTSVAESITFLNQSPEIDLIFCDIHLGDGICFEIFEKVSLSIPVIFCTAYDKYAINAFKHNGIDYILKPFSNDSVQQALDKYTQLSKTMASGMAQNIPLLDYNLLQQIIHPKSSSLLVQHKNKIIPVKINDIAVLNIEYKMVQIITLHLQTYFVQQTLDELEKLCGHDFFRVNRQYLVNKKAINEVVRIDNRKLLLKFTVAGTPELLVGKNKIPEFLNWLRM